MNEKEEYKNLTYQQVDFIVWETCKRHEENCRADLSAQESLSDSEEESDLVSDNNSEAESVVSNQEEEPDFSPISSPDSLQPDNDTTTPENPQIPQPQQPTPSPSDQDKSKDEQKKYGTDYSNLKPAQ
ncbi:MAG: hypothetical protein LBR43_02660, partial [Spiroplasmataceae bacterium]|nr:hypothetical protein [Spiroplasmataceae bacterium]